MNELSLPHNSTKRILELDGLRGIAILMVISFHYINNQLVNSSDKLSRILYAITSFGWSGVDLFFVLSGFLIGSVLIRNKYSKNYFVSFYLKRLARIIPNYYLLIVCFMIILSLPLFSGNHFLTDDTVIPIWSYFAMVHNLYMAKLNSMGTAFMSVTWSIGIEEQFYIFFPFIVYYIKDKWLPAVLITAIITANFLRMSSQNWIPAYVLLPYRMDAISLGILVAWINYHYNLQELTKKYFSWLIAILIADVVACAYLFIKYSDLGFVKNTLFAIVFSIVLLFALAFSESWYGAVLRNKILVWVGTISYSLYLFHYMILGIFNHIAGNVYGLAINGPKDIFLSIVAFIVSIVFSLLVYKYMETPMVNWGKRFKY